MQNFIPVFRGKTRDGRWVEGDLVREAFDGTSRIIPVGIQSPRCYPVEVLPETIGMSVGIDDLNKKSIYTSDIVTAHLFGRFDNDYFIKGVIEYDPQIGFGICVKGKEESAFYHFYHTSHFDEPCIEIIGNTTDNSDLLSN